EPWGPGSEAVGETLRALRALLRDGEETADDDGFLTWRLDGALAGRAPWSAVRGKPSSTPLDGDVFRSAPPITRHTMRPQPIERRVFRRLLHRIRHGRPHAVGPRHALFGGALRHLRRGLPWTRVAHRRRLVLGALVLIPTVIASE